MMASAPSKMAVATSETSARVGGGAHEGHGDEVDAFVDSEAEVLTVLRRETGHRQRDVGKRDALVIADAPSRDHAAAHRRGRRVLDLQLNHPVVHPDLVADLQ